MRYLKWFSIALGAIVVIAAALAATLAATFDANRYKGEIEQLVRAKTGRTLAISGELGLSFFPDLGLAIGKASLSEPGATKVFAKIDQARASVALLPLLAGRVTVDKVLLSGLSAELVRFRDGRTNFDDLAGGAAARSDAKPDLPDRGLPALDIAGVEIRDGNLSWRDERDGRSLSVSNLQLRTGRLADDVPGRLGAEASIRGTRPKLDLKLQLASDYRFNLATGAVALSGVDFRASGDVPGAAGLSVQMSGDLARHPARALVSASGVQATVTTADGIEARVSVPALTVSADRAEGKAASAAVKLARPGIDLDAKIALAALEAKGRSIVFPKLELDVAMRQGERSIGARVATPVSLDLEKSLAQLGSLAGELTLAGPDVPNKSMRFALSGSAKTDWAAHSASVKLGIKSEESNGEASVDVSRFSPLALVFNVALDRLNADRFLPPRQSSPTAAPAKAPAAPEQPIDLSALKALDLSGQIRIGQLSAYGVSLEKLLVTMKASGGRLEIPVLSANLYQGSTAGSASVDANAGRFALRQAMSGVALGPLLRDAANKDFLDGRGNVALDVQAKGDRVSALKRSLSGTANVNLRDGAIKGVDLGAMVGKARSLIGGKSAAEQSAATADRTEFSELSASFQIAGGVASNRDLSAKAPLLRLSGEGTIDIGADSMDYLARPTVVLSAQGQGGKDAKNLPGLTIPVRISGPFADLRFRPDLSAAAAEIARSRVGAAVQQAADKAKEQIRDQAAEQVRDRLKGLLRR